MAKARKRQPSISFTPHRKVMEHIDTLLRTGLYGRSRSELVKRLVSEGIIARVGHPQFTLRPTGPERWACKKCGKPRRRHECLSCGNKTPLSNEPRVSGLVS